MLADTTQAPSIRRPETSDATNKATNEATNEATIVSAKTGEGIEELMKRIQTWLVPTEPGAGQGVPFLPCHRDRIAKLNAVCR